MRTVVLTLEYTPIDMLVELIDEPYRNGCQTILSENRRLFEIARGSTHNHHTWRGGYIDHVTECMNYARYLFALEQATGRPLPFSLSDVLLIMFLHDLEKPWRIVVDRNGKVSNRVQFISKATFRAFRELKLKKYGIVLTPEQVNALTYVEGESLDYSSKYRVMNELATFCHMVDVWSARGRYDYPKEDSDEWTGATRFRTPRNDDEEN